MSANVCVKLCNVATKVRSELGVTFQCISYSTRYNGRLESLTFFEQGEEKHNKILLKQELYCEQNQKRFCAANDINSSPNGHNIFAHTVLVRRRNLIKGATLVLLLLIYVSVSLNLSKHVQKSRTIKRND